MRFEKTKLNFLSVHLESVLTLWLGFVCLAVQCFIFKYDGFVLQHSPIARHLPRTTHETLAGSPEEPEYVSSYI